MKQIHTIVILFAVSATLFITAAIVKVAADHPKKVKTEKKK